jgi:hypothetical protein
MKEISMPSLTSVPGQVLALVAEDSENGCLEFHDLFSISKFLNYILSETKRWEM